LLAAFVLEIAQQWKIYTTIIHFLFMVFARTFIADFSRDRTPKRFPPAAAAVRAV